MKEREQIMSYARREFPPQLSDLVETVKKRLQRASDYRDFQLANLRAQTLVEHKRAWNEFEEGKTALRHNMLTLAVERRRRLEALRPSGTSPAHPTSPQTHPNHPILAAVAKKKKRRLGASDRVAKRARVSAPAPLLHALETQGLVRIGLSPDEVNTDVALMLHGMDAARVPSGGGRLPPVRGIVARVDGGGRTGGEKIHSSRGTLHYHEREYEKGDRVRVVSGRGARGGVRYAGVLLGVNSKEIQVKGDDGRCTSVSFRVGGCVSAAD